MLSLVTAPTVEPLTVAEARRQLLLGTTAGEPAPAVPTVALLSPAAAGNCDNGAHRVGVTFVTADGETELGPLSDVVTVVDKTVNGRIAVSAISIGGTAVTARKIYLVPVAGGAAQLAATLSNNTATTATLNVADSALGAAAPSTNTTVDPEILRLITAVRERAELETGRALLLQTWDLLLDGFPDEGWIEVPKPPLTLTNGDVTYVKYYDTGGTLRTLTLNTHYLAQAPAGPRARPGRIALPFAGVWPTTIQQMGAVTIRFVAGYGAAASAVPAMLKAAMLMDLAALYADRENAITPGSKIHDIYWSYRAHVTQRVTA